jgi:hypothetical protein
MPASRDPSRLPVPRSDETHQSFLDLCMSSPEMLVDYPEPAQRASLCFNQMGVKPKVGGSATGQEVGKKLPCEIQLAGKVKFF